MAHHPITDAIHAGDGAHPDAAPLTTPIYATSTFVFESAAELEAYQEGRSAKYIYSRYANPTVQAAEAKLAALEGAEAALITSSGMAAIATALFGVLRPGDEVICSSAIYGGTLQIISEQLQRFGVAARFATLDELAAPEQLLTPATRAVWFESPINPTLRCVDIARLAAACRAGGGALSIIDNTFASPINQQPLALGVDLVMHSATKYLNGHSDVTAGALAGSSALIGQLGPARKLFGGVLEPASAYALARGMKTLDVRIARQNASAMAVAEWLSRHPKVTSVLYPGLASHPDHAIAARQMRGFGGMVTFDVGSYAAACRTFDRLQIIKRAASLGGVESLCSLPVLTSQYGFTDAQLQAAGVTRGMLRLSIGLEHTDDLIGDLEHSLN